MVVGFVFFLGFVLYCVLLCGFLYVGYDNYIFFFNINCVLIIFFKIWCKWIRLFYVIKIYEKIINKINEK